MVLAAVSGAQSRALKAAGFLTRVDAVHRSDFCGAEIAVIVFCDPQSKPVALEIGSEDASRVRRREDSGMAFETLAAESFDQSGVLIIVCILHDCVGACQRSDLGAEVVVGFGAPHREPDAPFNTVLSDNPRTRRRDDSGVAFVNLTADPLDQSGVLVIAFILHAGTGACHRNEFCVDLERGCAPQSDPEAFTTERQTSFRARRSEASGTAFEGLAAESFDQSGVLAPTVILHFGAGASHKNDFFIGLEVVPFGPQSDPEALTTGRGDISRTRRIDCSGVVLVDRAARSLDQSGVLITTEFILHTGAGACHRSDFFTVVVVVEAVFPPQSDPEALTIAGGDASLVRLIELPGVAFVIVEAEYLAHSGAYTISFNLHDWVDFHRVGTTFSLLHKLPETNSIETPESFLTRRIELVGIAFVVLETVSLLHNGTRMISLSLQD